MPLECRKWITRAMLRAEPGVLFVFGDNLERWGRGGQAAEMRGEPNAVGLPTKVSPKQYLTDGDLRAVKMEAQSDIDRLAAQLRSGGRVIWPADGIGTGLAGLSTHAPLVARFYDDLLLNLESVARAATGPRSGRPG